MAPWPSSEVGAWNLLLRAYAGFWQGLTQVCVKGAGKQVRPFSVMVIKEKTVLNHLPVKF